MSALHNARRWQVRYLEALDKRDEWIRRARKDGHSLAEIGQAVGLSRQRVHQIVTPGGGDVPP